MKQKSVQGGLVLVCAQGAKFLVQTTTTMLLARFLSAEDFGLQGMVLALTGFLSLFREAGLGTATIQRPEVTEEQISTLFWINAAVGFALTMAAATLAPVLAAFYGEPRLYWITIVSGVAFTISGLAAQHQALLLRRMQFTTVAKIDVLSLTISSAAGVAMALLGWRYWALVGMALVASIVSAGGVWLAIPWVPGRPRRKCGIRSMLHFGSIATCNNFVVFLAWNSDNILVGRFWGAAALGLYGRAFQLATLPILQLNAAINGVAFSALSRIQEDAERLARSFLRGYFFLLSLTIPTAITFALFTEDIVRVVLGTKWMEVAPILRLLVPTALVFALANPLSLLVISMGRAKRALSISAATTPLVILGIALGLSNGPRGVASGYSLAMLLIVFPIASWSKRATKITWADLGRTCKQPLVSGLMAGAAGLIVKVTLEGALPPILHLVVGSGFVFGVYAWVLLIVLRNKNLYMDLLHQVFSRPSPFANAG